MELRVGNKYRLGRKIGSGSFGDIYLGECFWLQLSGSGAPGTPLGTRRKDATISRSEARTWLWYHVLVILSQNHPRWGGKPQAGGKAGRGTPPQSGQEGGCPGCQCCRRAVEGIFNSWFLAADDLGFQLGVGKPRPG